MQESWRIFLQNHNAVIKDGRVDHFNNPPNDFKQDQSETVLVDLSHYGLLVFSGEDVRSFLQNQLTCDVKQADDHQVKYGGYCTPKGRVLANFMLWQSGDEWFMQLPLSLCPALQKRLSMFILRSKVQIRDCSDQRVRIGVAGSQVLERIAEIVHIPADELHQHQIIQMAQAALLCYSADRVELVVESDYAQELWKTLCQHAQPSGTAHWDRLEILAGIPMITPATQEEFLPQMINLDLIGGVSFKKGCYPGQEIIARTQYLGKLKRRMRRIHVVTDETVSAGDDLFGEGDDQSCGKIVNATPAPVGGFDALAVIQISSIETGKLFWKKPQGPVVEIGPLPYMQV
ncbi:MAG: folate-binding protein YgfZ [Nitrosomonas sp.]|nr:folate-binding protein YgfZ [Nitrosomonas sp.]